MAKLTKKAKSIAHLDADKLYGVDEALKLIKEASPTSLSEAVRCQLPTHYSTAPLLLFGPSIHAA